MATNQQRQRLQQGLCPSCGAQAAPYYFCDDCRGINMLRRVLTKGVKAGAFESKIDDRDRRRKLYAIGDKAIDFDYREALEGDQRLAPRLNKIPVDVVAEVHRLLTDLGSPVTEEELWHAWGTLRVRPGRVSVAQDLVAMIRAQRKRQRKARER